MKRKPLLQGDSIYPRVYKDEKDNTDSPDKDKDVEEPIREKRTSTLSDLNKDK